MEFEKVREEVGLMLVGHAGKDAGKAAILAAAALNNMFLDRGIVFRIQILGVTYYEDHAQS
jgi:hypothetical protein